MGSNNKKLIRALCDLAKAMRIDAEVRRMERFDKSINSFHSDMMSRFMAPAVPVKNYTDPTPLFKEEQESEEDRKAKFFKLCDMPAELASLLSSNYDEPITLLEEYFIQAQREADEENSLAKRIQRRRESVERNIADGVPVSMSIEIQTLYMTILSHMTDNGDRLLWKAIEEYTKSDYDPATIDDGIRRNLINFEEQLDVTLGELWPIGFTDREFMFQNLPMRKIMKITNPTIALLRRYTQFVPTEEKHGEMEEELSTEELLNVFKAFGKESGKAHTIVRVCFSGRFYDEFAKRRDCLINSDEWKEAHEEVRFLMVCEFIKEYLNDIGPTVFDYLVKNIDEETSAANRLLLYKGLRSELMMSITHRYNLGALELTNDELGYKDGCTVKEALNIGVDRGELIWKRIMALNEEKRGEPDPIDPLILHHTFIGRCNFSILYGLFRGNYTHYYNSELNILLAHSSDYKNGTRKERVRLVAQLLAKHLRVHGVDAMRDILEHIKGSRQYPRSMEYTQLNKNLFDCKFSDLFEDIGVPATEFGYEEDTTIGQMIGLTKGEFNRLFDEVFSGNKSPD